MKIFNDAHNLFQYTGVWMSIKGTMSYAWLSVDSGLLRKGFTVHPNTATTEMWKLTESCDNLHKLTNNRNVVSRDMNEPNTYWKIRQVKWLAHTFTIRGRSIKTVHKSVYPQYFFNIYHDKFHQYNYKMLLWVTHLYFLDIMKNQKNKTNNYLQLVCVLITAGNDVKPEIFKEILYLVAGGVKGRCPSVHINIYMKMR